MHGKAFIAGITSSVLFVTLNVAMNLYMKWLFTPTGGNFALPWTMLAIQQVEAYCVLQPWIAYRDPAKKCGWGLGSSRPKSDDNNDGENDDDHLGWHGMLQVLAVTVLFCLNVGLNSLSLVRISITLNQTVRAFLPVGVLLLAVAVERRGYPSHSYATTGVLVLGIALTCCGSPEFELYGFSLALGSTLVAALGSSLNGRLLSNGPFGNAGPDKIMRLMMLQSVPAFMIFGFVAFIAEGDELRLLINDEDQWQWVRKFGLVSFSSALALLSNIGRCVLVAATSALMETFAGNAKVALICIIDNQLFGTALNFYNYVGIGLTFSGFSAHVLLQYATSSSSQDEEPPPNNVEAPPAEDDLDPFSGQPTTQSNFNRQTSPHHPALGSVWKGLNRPRLISASDTGLASEHLALQLGRAHKPKRHTGQSVEMEDGDMPPLPKQRSATWQAGQEHDEAESWLGRRMSQVHVDLQPVFEEPSWLISEPTTPRSEASMEWGHTISENPGYGPLPRRASEARRQRTMSEPVDIVHASDRKARFGAKGVVLSTLEEDADAEDGDTWSAASRSRVGSKVSAPGKQVSFRAEEDQAEEDKRCSVGAGSRSRFGTKVSCPLLANGQIAEEPAGPGDQWRHRSDNGGSVAVYPAVVEVQPTMQLDWL